MIRYLRLFGVQVRASLQTVMQYRADFFVQGAMSLYWLGWNLLPLFILYEDRTAVAGWDFPSALVVIAWFVILRGILEGAINPSLVDVVDKIRTGSFDYLLLKPADSQFLVSTARFDPWRIVDVLGGVALLVYAFVQLGRWPTVADVAAGSLLLASGVIVMYALWIGIVAASFWVIRLDNLTYLLDAVFDTARWPAQIFKGAWRIIFTFILPLALMTTYPAMAILGRIELTTAIACVAASLGLAIGARLLWIGAVRNYTSASS
ncbi:MAG TPA: ABC-2 family transporter protein [Kofleriaceae bacterium]|nr:ABC-2 family transporter protein [Kofleriaceae bacterium]